MALDIVIMAAGKGTRMKSTRPKVLHRLAGRSLLEHVLDAASSLQAERTVVVTGHGADLVEAAVHGPGRVFARQEPQLGTGHAVQQAAPHLHDEGTTLILNGDVPLIEPDTLQGLVRACGGKALALLAVVLDDPSGYGRLIRSGDPVGGTIEGIVEHKDATPQQRHIQEVYTGVMAAPTAHLKRWLAALSNDNAQREYYLTDVVAMAVADHVSVVATHAHDETEVLGINSPAQLAELERRYQRRVADALMEAGVRLADPSRIDVRGTLLCGQDVEIDVNCVFEGRVELGDNVRIESHCVLRNLRIEDNAVVHSFTHADGEKAGARIGRGAEVGPFARLRPGADLGEDVHIGNFVEVKNSVLGKGSKANHLAYLGDATVGERVNYGAGSITANYDGAYKHRTVLGDDVHVGSNCVLVAPITVGAGATIGAGSTVAKDAPAGQLTVARAKAVSLDGWRRPVKVKK
ncbi:bifunctional UDP-N-acetylglucosamine diphosphorylase/glucosamine-1-phosphate N-acetyltransferase GlmU [uncultured Piscinibacter sp.]|uniref:bifunctional UDP-N-acetylglucosamine diphosphorylase/glucosamine-1-phosphate N-acetyltransferase GlmU n=1 Tax=uncultured Piscinibacter sp. TaxID=1131835 RepID=UPI0026398C33|nr:bifunctional UDP-N-acetylglucosamine diphosphorylase/glucosamine-1-phosphate N-acetyltransferase GlmU [uncultured Piscinibacter sp.]